MIKAIKRYKNNLGFELFSFSILILFFKSFKFFLYKIKQLAGLTINLFKRQKKILLSYIFLCFGLYMQGQTYINEIIVVPPNAADANWNSLIFGSQGAEGIEIYNPTCQVLDISHWFLATNGDIAQNRGTFRFPAGTTIPVGGRLTVGAPGTGSIAGALTSNFILQNYNLTSNLGWSGSRWYLDNSRGYVALYDANGNPKDLVYWHGSSTGEGCGSWNNVSYTSFSTAPQYVPTGSVGAPVIVSLPGPGNPAIEAVKRCAGYVFTGPPYGSIQSAGDGKIPTSRVSTLTYGSANAGSSTNPCTPFSECNLVAYKIGDGSTALSNSAFPFNVEEISSTGSLIQTLPSLMSQAGSQTSLGYLNSYNGLLGLPGYNLVPGTSPASTTNTKVTQIIDANSVTTSTTVHPTTPTNPFSGDSYRSVVPLSNNTFYCSGSSSSGNGGVWYYNGTTFIQICTNPNNVRNIEIYNGQLYMSTGTTITAPPLNGQGIYQVGSGLPTTSGQTVTPIFNQSGGEPYGFSISPDGCTAYVADDRSSANGGGIKKWTKVGGTWSLLYTIGSPSRGITVDYSGSNPIIYATTSETSNNSIIKITDVGPSSTATTLRSAGDKYVFRGIDFTPNSYNSISISEQPSSFTVCEGSSSQELSVSATNSNGSLSYQWYSNSINDYCGATSISGATKSTYTPPVNSIGTIYYFVKITNNCASIKNSNIVAVTVNKAAAVSASVSNSNPCTDATINLTGSFGGSATSGTWTVKSGGGTLNISVNPPTYTAPSTAGMVILSYTSDDPDDPGPCSVATADVEITVANCVSCPGFWANTQSPASGSICSNGPFDVYGQLYIPGVTEGDARGDKVIAQLGYYTSDTDPSTWPSENWVNATHNPSVKGNNDEYMGTLSGLSGNKTYHYAFRYSYNNCPFVYGGYSAPSSNKWTINTGDGGAFVGSSNNNGNGGISGINSSNGLAFGLYNSSGQTTEAIRNFSAVGVGQSIQFDMDNGLVVTGKSVGVGLQNATGQNVWEIYFSGEGSSYVINTGSSSPSVNIPYTTSGLRINFTLTSSSSYSATVQALNGGATYGPYTGNLLNPSGGQSITRLRAFNFNAGNGPNYDFFVNNIYTPTFSDNASGYSSGNLVTDSPNSSPPGGIWNNNPNVNGILKVTASPTTAIAGSPQTICEGTSATLAANSPTVGTGAWTITSGPNKNTNQLSSTSANNPSFTPTAAGEYNLVWTLTNTYEGKSCESSSPVKINVTSGILDFVNTQFPGTSAICSGESINVYGQVYEPSVTPGSGKGSNIDVQVGYHSENTNPNTWTNWIDASYNSALIGNNDEYMGTFGSALSAGTYYYAFRYRLNRCAWQYGGYSISGGGTWDGTNNISGVLTVYNNPGTVGLAMTPSNICAGVPNIKVEAKNAGSYELFLNGISQGVPSATSSWTISDPLKAGDKVCVRGYAATNLITMDGAFNEDFWNPPLVNSVGGALSNTENRINALYVKNAHGFLNIGIAGKLVYGDDRKILLFVDSKTGGHNSLSTWTNRSNVSQNNGLKNLNGGMQFDPGFTADYAISIGTNISEESFLDFYDMITNTNNYLGSTITKPTPPIAYKENASATDYSKGYEIRIPINLFDTITSPMKFFAMLTNNPPENEATTLSNQFLSRANAGENDYGSGSVNFGIAAPNPVSYLLESDCYNEECKTVLAKPTVNVSKSSVCINDQINLSPNSGGKWISSDNSIATIDNSGLVKGVSGGKATFTFTADNGCSNSTNPIDIIEIKTSVIESE